MFRFVQLRKYSPNSRCRPPSCLLAVFAMFLSMISPSSSCSSYSWNEWSVRHFSFTTKTTQTRPQVFLVNRVLTCRRLHFLLRFLVKHKILPNLVMSNCLWWIMHELLANQNWGKYFEWIIIIIINWQIILIAFILWTKNPGGVCLTFA